ncbi:unnamed protein product, partial [Laminaria digitata]
CPHCDVVLWQEERRRRFNCCQQGAYAINPLQDVDPELWETFHSQEFHNNQRRYNSLFSFTALAADGVQKRTWTNPSAPTMLTMHGRAYHRIFDLEETYDMMSVTNTARLYIYDSDFANQFRASNVDEGTATIIRDYIQTNIPWAGQYRAAVDEVIASPDVHSGPAFIEFAEVSRANDGPVIGQRVSSNEIAAIVYSDGQQCSSSQRIV